MKFEIVRGLVEADEADKADKVKAHPFEMSGCGVGPFKLVGVWHRPSPFLAEANPSAYENAMRAAPPNAGYCHHCGRDISYNFILRDSRGKQFIVGSDCVMKSGDETLGNEVEIARLRAEREAKRQLTAARENAKREKWLASPEGKAHVAAQEAKRKEQAEREERRITATKDRFGFLLPILDGQSGDFCRSIASNIRRGEAPYGRALNILQDIYAKSHGRRGSKAYDAAYDEFERRVGDDEES